MVEPKTRIKKPGLLRGTPSYSYVGKLTIFGTIALGGLLLFLGVPMLPSNNYTGVARAVGVRGSLGENEIVRREHNLRNYVAIRKKSLEALLEAEDQTPAFE